MRRKLSLCLYKQVVIIVSGNMRISVAQVAVAYALHIGVSHGTPSKSAEDSLLLATPGTFKQHGLISKT